ncbi:hypothetical protein pEaSNUABM50_00333 [Erwinia phage pEa_SNUABM_50]|uniref:Uncharacterized protein n=2 Tax=Eneladusvirus BF TaxID=2560751 RepID=A0A7L8ZNJ8_9CAUD|nr:hypothetical protein pEaSNUABM47_00334 [Erwinia phage pEa_SNUABM_47]QOI72357.1 hypothetical protein pEaSNUABM50_00333 [Erwinia phage pEa_SNUABM_50]QXO11483.1 hypothetical protein pEaSNUABM19_00337 [Erwinia phage pEa_SNUABM_19]QXO12584.1 hypothetical protein pEaSNUABM49_00338 [Erwinia phage pEa_SNUABM_49]
MKGKYFFKDTNGNPVEIQEFDYEYVRNSLLKVFDKNVAKKYIFNVVVRRDYDSMGLPVFDVRPLNLNEIYYDSTRLRVLEMMLDDIYFGRISIKELAVPRLQQEYNEFLEGRTKPAPVPAIPDVPAPIVHTRVEISENDPRIMKIATIDSNVPILPMKVLDWIDNFEVCSQEMTVCTQKLSEEQIRLVQVLKTNSDYIHSVFSNLTSVLETMFPLKPSFTQRLFGTKKDIEVKQDELGTILSTLRNAVSVDPNRFSGIGEVFKNIQSSIQEIKDSVEQGVVGCKYVIQTTEDAYEFELRQERLMKIRATTEISELSLVTINKKFLSDLNKLKEVQEVVVPLLIIKLQNQATKKVDDETVNIIRNLAYSRDAEKPILPPEYKPEDDY